LFVLPNESNVSLQQTLECMTIVYHSMKLKLKYSSFHQRKLHRISYSCRRAEEKETSAQKRKLTFKYKSLCPARVVGQGKQGFFRKNKKDIGLVFYIIRFFSPWLLHYTAFLNKVSKILLSFPVRCVYDWGFLGLVPNEK
jgi:hypothetical protein